MFRSYLKTAVANLVRSGVVSVINIAGLALGLAAFIMISLYVLGETSYDRHWEDADDIYRVQQVITFQDYVVREMQAPGRLLPVLKEYFADDLEVAAQRYVTDFTGLKQGEQFHSTDISYIEPEFADIIQFEEVTGNLDSVLNNTSTLGLSEGTARQLFGDDNPVGQVITAAFYTGGSKDYTVGAVYKLRDGNTTLDVPAIALFDETELSDMFGFSQNWGSNPVEVFLKLPAGSDARALEAKFPDLIDAHVHLPEASIPPGEKLSDSFLRYQLQAVRDTYLDGPIWPYLKDDYGNPVSVAVFSIIAFLVLLVACTNFIILTLAKSSRRAREVALRKASGASWKQLLIQFLGESFLVTLIAMMLALAFVELAMPIFQEFIGTDLRLLWQGVELYGYLAILVVILSVLMGLYPALVIARKPPARIFKANQTAVTSGSNRLMNSLAVFQFSVSIALLIATAVVFLQLLYVDGRDPGFSPENLLEINVSRPGVRGYSQTLKQEVARLPQVEEVTLSGLDPGEDSGIDIGLWYFRDDQSSEEGTGIPSLPVGYDFFETFRIPLVAGRYYQPDIDPVEEVVVFSDQDRQVTEFSSGNVVLNIAAVEELGFKSAEDALGRMVYGTGMAPRTSSRIPFTIVGIVGDGQYRSLRRKPAPEVYRLSSGTAFFLTVRYTGNAQQLLEELESLWHSIVGDAPFEVGFVGEEVAQTFRAEQREGYMVIAFALLSILIACMGLFGITALTVERRVQEIGIRKVMGAEVNEIVRLLLWQFSKPVLWANIVAWPIAIWALLHWLQRFPYQIDSLLILPVCIFAGAMALSIAWATVVSNTMRAACAKPVQALRYE